MRPRRRIAVRVLLPTLAGGGLLLLALSLVAVAPPVGSTLRACFDDIGGLESGDPVYLRGLRVGEVRSIALDADFRPCAELDIDGALALPLDSSAAIETENLLGDRSVALQPGGAEEPLADGDEIAFTQSALTYERLVGRLIHELADR